MDKPADGLHTASTFAEDENRRVRLRGQKFNLLPESPHCRAHAYKEALRCDLLDVIACKHRTACTRARGQASLDGDLELILADRFPDVPARSQPNRIRLLVFLSRSANENDRNSWA